MPGGDSSFAEVGGDTGGFRVTGTPQAALRIEVWGYWSPDVLKAFARDAPAASQKLVPGAVFTLDATHLKPQGAEGQDALRTLFRALAPLTLAKGTVLANNVMTVMQLTRLLRECGMDQRLTFG
jgi:hypothetical protein